MPGTSPRNSLHATAVARAGRGVLLLGPSGSGKSDLALRLIERGFVLVADDRVVLENEIASAPPALAGLLEVRGLGIVRLSYVARVRIDLVVDLAAPVERLPRARCDRRLPLDAFAQSAPAKVALALDCLDPRAAPELVSGVFYKMTASLPA